MEKMETGQINFIHIDLPKSHYYFTLRVTFWQTFLNCLSILFMAIDTTINDVTERAIDKISHSFKQVMEKVVGEIEGALLPGMACA